MAKGKTFLIIALIITGFYVSRTEFHFKFEAWTTKPAQTHRKGTKSTLPYLILLYTPYFGGNWESKYPTGISTTDCNVRKQCEFTTQHERIHSSDIVLFHGNDLLAPQDMQKIPRNPQQIWLFMTQENPFTVNTGKYRLGDYDNLFNWTATYYHKSEIITPYYDVIERKHQIEAGLIEKEVGNKSNLVFSVMSNC
eukprot:TCONS_00046839-protein